MASENPALSLEIVLADGTVKKVFRDLEKESDKAGGESGGQFGKKFTKESDKEFKGMFDKFKSDFTSSFSTVGFGVLAAGLVAQGLGAIRGFVSGSIEAANRQEDAINSLNSALQRTNEFTESASQEFQKFASDIQSRSIFGDELILEQAAFAKSLGLTNQQTKQVVQAAVELSSALNIDLNSAVRNISKTYSGLQGELGELLPSMKSLTAEQLKAGGATQLILDQFSGAAESRIQTTRGAYDQLSNSFGDLAEKIGAAFTSSQIIQSSLRGLNRVVQDILAPTSVTQAQKLGSEIENLQKLIRTETNRGSDSSIIEPLQRNLDLQKANLRTLLIDQQAAADRATVIEKEKQAQIEKVAQEARQKRLAEISAIGLTELQQLENKFLLEQQALSRANEDKIISETEYQERLFELRRQYEEREKEIKLLAQQEEGFGPDFNGLFEGFTAGFNSINLQDKEKQLKDFSKSVKKFGQDTRNSLLNGFASGAGNAFAAFGQALVNGENALAAFAKAFLGSIGQMLIQQGTAFILQGIAISANPYTLGAGGPLIAAGAAMAAFGGVLTAFSGGSPGSPANNNSDQSYASSDFGSSSIASGESEIEERREAAPVVHVNVSGNVLGSDRDGLARAIVDLIRDAGDFQGVRVV